MVAFDAVRGPGEQSAQGARAAGQEQGGGRPPAHAHGAPQLASAPARPTQRELLLDEAARQFNARGIAATSVNQVAKRVGLTRAAATTTSKTAKTWCSSVTCAPASSPPTTSRMPTRTAQTISNASRNSCAARLARAAIGSGRERDCVLVRREAHGHRGRARTQHRGAGRFRARRYPRGIDPRHAIHT